MVMVTDTVMVTALLKESNLAKAVLPDILKFLQLLS